MRRAEGGAVSLRDDVRVVTDALDMLITGGLPSWRPMTTTTGGRLRELVSTLALLRRKAESAETNARMCMERFSREVDGLREEMQLVTDALERERQATDIARSLIARSLADALRVDNERLRTARDSGEKGK